MLTIRRLSLGKGYRYLMESIAAGDGREQQSSPLTRYYAESGTPPGVFLGSGLAFLGGPAGVQKGSQVSETHLYRMLGEVTDPITGEPLGRTANTQPLSLEKRVEKRFGRLPDELPPESRAAMRRVIEAEERARSRHTRPAVAGFDLTFSPLKSVSTVWALADQGTQAVIFECHRRAIDYVLTYAEEHVLHSRSGTNGVVQEDIVGVVAASFTHYDTRAGDPQLHDHLVVWNRAKSKSDGQWRTLDSRGLYKSVVTLGVMHEGVLSDLLTEALGVGWDQQCTRGGMLKTELAGVPEALMREFSQRREVIEEWRQGLVARFATEHGREPSPVELMRLNQEANLATRRDKRHRSLAEMTDDWRARAVEYVGDDIAAWVSSLRHRNDLPLLHADDLADDILADAASVACQKVAERHSTFSRSNVLAEVHRQLQGVLFASPDDRVAVAERTADIALGTAIQVTAPELHHVPERYKRADGTSRLRPADHRLYTTAALMDAESRLFAAGRRASGPAVAIATVAAVADQDLPGRDYAMSTDQALAVEKVATSGRYLDLLVGPAGTGKSTTMAGLKAAWEAEHGAGSVIGLAPSAAAAEVLADELAIGTENTAKWLHEHRQTATRRAELDEVRRLLGSRPEPIRVTSGLRERVEKLEAQVQQWSFGAGQLVIVDEASLAGTFALDELAAAAEQAGAKLLLVGDPYQLTSVDAGGMFRSLARDRADLAPELTDVRRFKAGWEKVASAELRVGNEHALDAYLAHGRVSEGPRDELVDRVYCAWRGDLEMGKSSLMVTSDSATAAELNRRARAHRIAIGEVLAHGLEVAGGATAGIGDEVVTRENNRLLATGRRWVRNGDRWTVTATHKDGSMIVKRARGNGEVVLPADYVAEHVELAYASTAHRVQGQTVDTAHALVSPTTTREVLYVAATRGRESNRIYVDTHYDPDPHTGHEGVTQPQTAREVLAGVIQREGADLGAHETIRTSHEAADGMLQLHAEYTTLAKSSQAERWDSLLERSGLSARQLVEVRESDAYGPLVAAFRDAESCGLDVETTFPHLVAARSLADAEDIASVLHGRVDRWVEAAGSKRVPAADLIVGLVPRAKGVADEDMARALRERDEAMERRATILAEQAVQRNAGWVRRLGAPPVDPATRAAWIREVRVVAAYRDRWGTAGKTVVDRREDARTIEQLGHQRRAQAAAARAMAITCQGHERQDRTGADVPSQLAETTVLAL